jgi:hypothetical protein
MTFNLNPAKHVKLGLSFPDQTPIQLSASGHGISVVLKRIPCQLLARDRSYPGGACVVGCASALGKEL